MSRPQHPAGSVTNDRAERAGWAGPSAVHQPGSVQRSTQRPPPDPAAQPGQFPQGADEPADRLDPARPARPQVGAAPRSKEFRPSSDFGPSGNWLG